MASKSILLSQLLGSLIPAVLGLYWIVYASDHDVAILLFRPLILAISAALFLLFYYRVPVTHAEQKLAMVLAILCAVLLAPSLAATDPVRALQEWVKLLIICSFSIMLCRALRHAPTAKAFGISLILASALIGLFMVATYLSNMGPVLPTYKTVREFKGTLGRSDVSLNTISFACVFAYICGRCLISSNRLLWVLGAVLLVISSVLTGSRAPVAALASSGVVLITINALRSRRLLVVAAGWALVVVIVAGVTVTLARLSFSEMSAVTEGRWDLWSVAARKVIDHPVLGYGYLSWSDDLASRLPGDYKLSRDLAKGLASGGYHNEYLTALAEQGIVGLLAVASLFWYLIRCCWSLSFRRSYTWQHGQWALFGCLVLLLRASVEVPGLFGYAQEPADFLSYAFLAIIVSQISREEDYVLWQRARQVSYPLSSRAGRGLIVEKEPAGTA